MNHFFLWLQSFLADTLFYNNVLYPNGQDIRSSSTISLSLVGKIPRMKPAQARSWMEWNDLFLQSLVVSKSRSKNTLSNARSVIKKLVAFFNTQGISSPEQVTTEVLVEFLQPIGHPATRRNALYYVSLFCEQMGLSPNPASDIKAPRVNPTEAIRFFEPHVLRLLLNTLQSQVAIGKWMREYALVLLSLYTGIRPNEALALKKEDIRANGEIYIRDSKTHTSRVTQIPEHVLQIIQTYHERFPHSTNPYVFYAHHQPTTGPLSYNTVSSAFRALLKEAGISRYRLNLHALRHTFSRALMEADFHREYIQKLLGHKSIQTTAIYTSVSDQDVLKKTPLISMAIKDYLNV